MANCIGHSRCPSCAKHGRDNSGNNLGNYDDGSSYCFSCFYRTLPTNLRFNFAAGIRGRSESDYITSQGNREVKRQNRLTLPTDSKPLIDTDYDLPWNYVLKYGLTTKEISDNLLCFSERGIYLERKDEEVAPLLIFPIYGDGELLFWTGRNLAYKDSGTKWVIKGKKEEMIHEIVPDMYKVGMERYASCCVCEDIISTIKLGRIMPTYTLFGKNISDTLLKYLCLNYSELLIYLDFDAIDTMMKLKQRYEPYFSKIRLIISKQDPKEYSTEELREIIK